MFLGRATATCWVGSVATILTKDARRWRAGSDRSCDPVEQVGDKGGLATDIMTVNLSNLSLPHHPHGLETRQRLPRRTETAEAEPRPNKALDTPVVLLDDVVQIFTLSQTAAAPSLTVAFHIGDRSGIGRILVDGESARVDDVPLRDGLAKEPVLRGRIPPRRQKEIDRLPSAVHRPIEIRPASLHPNVGFVHPPGAVAHSQMRADSLFKLRSVGLDPSEDRRVVDLDSAVEEHEFQITVADRKHQVPSHGPKDHLGCELAPLEAITQTHSDARPIVPHSIIPELRQQRSLQQNRRRCSSRPFNPLANKALFRTRASPMRSPRDS